jgi:hypothetical protein
MVNFVRQPTEDIVESAALVQSTHSIHDLVRGQGKLDSLPHGLRLARPAAARQGSNFLAIDYQVLTP